MKNLLISILLSLIAFSSMATASDKLPEIMKGQTTIETVPSGGGSVVFNGTDYFESANITINYDYFMVMVWVKLNGTLTTNQNHLINIANHGRRLGDPIGTKGWSFGINTTLSNPTQAIMFEVDDGANKLIGIKAPPGSTDLFDGNWHHIGFSYDASLKKARYFTDFSSEPLNDNTANALKPNAFSITGALRAGGYSGFSAGSYSIGENGYMDELRIYSINRAIVTEQALANLQGASGAIEYAERTLEQLGAPPLACTTLGRWSFSATSGNIAADSSGNNNTLTHKDSMGRKVNATWSANIIGQKTYYGGMTGNEAVINYGPSGQEKVKTQTPSISLPGDHGYVVIPDDVSNKFTIGELRFSTWFKQLNNDTGGGYLVSKPWNGWGDYNYFLRATGGTLTFCLGSRQCGVTAAIPNPWLASASSAYVYNTWNFVEAHANVYKTDTGYIAKMELSLNGEVVAQFDNLISPVSELLTNPTINGKYDTNKNLTLGTLYDYGELPPAPKPLGQLFKGKIDEFKLIKDNTLINYFDFLEGSGRDAHNVIYVPPLSGPSATVYTHGLNNTDSLGANWDLTDSFTDSSAMTNDENLLGFDRARLADCINGIVLNSVNKCFVKNNNSGTNSAVSFMNSRTYINDTPLLEVAAIAYKSKTVIGDVYGSLDNFAFWGKSLNQGAGVSSSNSDAAYRIGYAINPNAQASMTSEQYTAYRSKIDTLAGEGAETNTGTLNSTSPWFLESSNIGSLGSGSSPEGKVWTIKNQNVGSDLILRGSHTYTGKGTLIIQHVNLIANNNATLTPDDANSKLGIIVLDGKCEFKGNNKIQAAIFCMNSDTSDNVANPDDGKFISSDNSEFTGSFVANNFNINGVNTRFYYDYDFDDMWPPGFKYLNMPHATNK